LTARWLQRAVMHKKFIIGLKLINIFDYFRYILDFYKRLIIDFLFKWEFICSSTKNRF